MIHEPNSLPDPTVENPSRFQVANVVRLSNRPGVSATFDLLLNDDALDLSLRDCSLVKDARLRFSISFANARLDPAFERFLAARVAGVYSERKAVA